MKIKMMNYMNNLQILILTLGILSIFFVDYASGENMLHQNINRQKFSMPKFSCFTVADKNQHKLVH